MRPLLTRRKWSVMTVVGVFACVLYALPARPGQVACPPTKGASLLVDTKKHTLALCDGGHAVSSFGVRIGKKGTGKTREGDERTPLGRYALGGPISSATFGVFLPIGYPTPEQRTLGYTGSAVGVHGPHRDVRFLGRWVNAFDTTDGCVGLATDAEMKDVADFVTKHGARAILIQ